jgi:hypothetical protein
LVQGVYNINIIQEEMVGMKKIDKEAMKKAYVEMGEINVSISEGITEDNTVWNKEVEKDAI